MAIKSIESPRGSFPITGPNTRSPDLLSNVRTQSVYVTLTGTLTLAGGPATAAVNGGSLLGAIQRIVLSDNGKDEVTLTGMELLAISAAEGSAGRATRLTSFANGVTVLREQVRIPLAALWPLAASPIDTSYVQPDGKATLSVLVSLDSPNAVGTIVVTAGTAVLTGVTATIEQESDVRGGLVAALPRYQARSLTPIPGSIAGLEIPIRTPHLIRGLLIYGTTANRGDVNDIITALSIRSDSREILGPNTMPFADAVDRFVLPGAGSAAAIGGFSAVAGATPAGVYLWLDFVRLGSGRLSNVISPRIGTNLRLVVDAAPSAVAGALGSSVAVMMSLLRRDAPGLVVPDKALPFSFD